MSRVAIEALDDDLVVVRRDPPDADVQTLLDGIATRVRELHLEPMTTVPSAILESSGLKLETICASVVGDDSGLVSLVSASSASIRYLDLDSSVLTRGALADLLRSKLNLSFLGLDLCNVPLRAMPELFGSAPPCRMRVRVGGRALPARLRGEIARSARHLHSLELVEVLDAGRRDVVANVTYSSAGIARNGITRASLRPLVVSARSSQQKALLPVDSVLDPLFHEVAACFAEVHIHPSGPRPMTMEEARCLCELRVPVTVSRILPVERDVSDELSRRGIVRQ